MRCLVCQASGVAYTCQCGTAAYCGTDCQLKDWKQGHALACIAATSLNSVGRLLDDFPQTFEGVIALKTHVAEQWINDLANSNLQRQARNFSISVKRNYLLRTPFQVIASDPQFHLYWLCVRDTPFFYNKSRDQSILPGIVDPEDLDPRRGKAVFSKPNKFGIEDFTALVPANEAMIEWFADIGIETFKDGRLFKGKAPLNPGLTVKKLSSQARVILLGHFIDGSKSPSEFEGAILGKRTEFEIGQGAINKEFIQQFGQEIRSAVLDSNKEREELIRIQRTYPNASGIVVQFKFGTVRGIVVDKDTGTYETENGWLYAINQVLGLPRTVIVKKNR